MHGNPVVMAHCQFDANGKCRICGFQGLPGSRSRLCKAPPSAHRCIHRGNQLRTQQCSTCSGTVKVKVFACAMHGECELANKLKDVRRCGKCDDFQSAEMNSQPQT